MFVNLRMLTIVLYEIMASLLGLEISKRAVMGPILEYLLCNSTYLLHLDPPIF